MPFAERSRGRPLRLLAAAGCVVGVFLAGCASAARKAEAPAASISPAPLAAPAAVAAPEATKTVSASVAAPAGNPAAAPALPPPVVPVDAATTQAFDDAITALRAGRTADAERAFAALAQAHPEFAGPHANLGLIRRQAGRLAEAVSELERAVEINPQQRQAWNQLGIARRQLGEFDKARAAFDRAIAIDPGYAAAVLNLGVLDDLYLDNAPAALALYERYLALTPGGDPLVAKWVAELKNRKPVPGTSTPAQEKK